MKTKNLIPLLFACLFNFSFLLADAQIFPPQPVDQDPHRSLMVDQFIRINNNSPQGSHVFLSPEHSILSVDQDNNGIYEREEELLKYCDDNHITHLILYDTYRIFNPWPSSGEIRAWDQNTGQNLTLREHFCRFIHNAKTNHNITEISINGGGGLADVIDASAVFMQPSPEMEFTADELANPEINSRFLYLTDPINNGVPKAELAKFTLRALGFGGCNPCDEFIDYVNYEDEFWHSGGNFFADVEPELEDLYVAQQIYNSAHVANPIGLEMYIHDFVDGTCSRHPIAAFIDGSPDDAFFNTCNFGGGGAPPHPRVINRINLTYYAIPYVQPTNWDSWPNMSRLQELRDDSHNNPGTLIYPLINAEDRQWGGYYDFLGKFFREKYPETQVYGNYLHNIFNAEATLYHGYLRYDLGVGSSNIAYPGGATWFASSQMCGKIFDPDPVGAAFPNLRNRRLDVPVIFSISEGILTTDPVTITYQGPIEQVTNFTVDLCAPDLTVICNLLTVPATSLLTGTNVWPNSFTVPLCSQNTGHFLAVAHITYSNGHIYEQREHLDIVSTTSAIKIVNDPDLYEGDPSLDNKDELTVCDGQVVTLQGRFGAAWFRNGQLYEKGTNNISTQYLVVTESGLYEQAPAGSGNVLQINFLRNPQIQILATESGPGPNFDLNLTATTLGDGSTASTQYIWTTGETTQSILAVHLNYSTVPHYHVTAIQDNGCIRSDKFAVRINQSGNLDILPPNNPIIPITIIDDICGTAAFEGKIEINPQDFAFANDYTIFIEPGNDTIYDPFSVDPNNNRINIYDLEAGDYTIHFIFNGYGNVFDYTQTFPIGMVGGTPYTYTPTITQLPNCNFSNGEIELTGIQPAGTTVTWSPFGQNSTTISNLGAGTYRVDFISPGNCPSFDLFTIDPPANSLRIIKANVDDETCNGSDGEVHIASPWGFTGGTPPYDISLTGQVTYTNVTSANWTGLDNGDYTLTVTDNVGCSSSIDLHVGEAIPISVIVEQTPELCMSPSGVDVTVHVCDGVPGYEINLNGTIVNNVDEHTFTIAPGTYTLTVTDGSNPSCVYVDNSFVVAAPNYLAVNITATESCPGSDNGTATAVTTGGTPPYSFNWSNGSTTYQAINLSPGNYSVTVTDADGCTAVANTTITQSSPINIAFTTTPVCTGGNYGAIDITPTGGTTPYSYFWQPVGAISEDINGLTPGQYSAQVTDANGCTNTLTVDIHDITCCGNFFPSTYINNDFAINNNILLNDADLNATVSIPPFTTITISGAQIAIVAGVNIVVQHDAVLNITDNATIPSRLFACGDMWGGIIVEPGGTLNISGNSIIADAERGVFVQETTGPITNVNSNIAQFQSCYEGIVVQRNSIGQFNTINLDVVHTGFYTPYPLKHSANFIVGNTTYAGMELNNIIATIGSTMATYNWFYNMNIGIISNQSILTVVNSDFTAMRTDAAYSSVFNGSGIYARGDNSIYTLQYNGHGKYAAPCFLKCDYAVYIDGVSGFVRDSHIGSNIASTDNVQHGIYITNLARSASFICADNYIECIWFGIEAFSNPNANEIKIYGNEIDVNNPNARGYGIGATEMLASPQIFEISNNVVNLDQGSIGINVTGTKGLKVLHNLIFMSNSFAFAGISIIGADKNFFVCNEVTGADGATPNINHNGFYLGTSQKNYIRCNRVNLVSKGFQIDGYCKMDEWFLGNTMETCWRGLNINIDGVLGFQHDCGNIWSGPFTDQYPAYNAGNPAASIFWVNFGDLPPYHPAFWPGGFFKPSAGVHYECSDDVLCDGSHARMTGNGNSDQLVAEGNYSPDEENQNTNPGMVQSPYALVYPNPSDEQIVINWFLPLDGKSTLTIFNSSLEIVASYEIEGKKGSKNIDVLNFQSGFYVYSLIQNGEKVYSGKFSIIH